MYKRNTGINIKKRSAGSLLSQRSQRRMGTNQFISRKGSGKNIMNGSSYISASNIYENSANILHHGVGGGA
jgi:hypothetical protein